MNDLQNNMMTNTKMATYVRYGLAFFMQPASFDDLGTRQYCAGISLPSHQTWVCSHSVLVAAFQRFGVYPRHMPVPPRLSSLLNHVSRVFGGGSDKQMIRTDASRIITAMANKHSGGNLAMFQFIGKAMGRYVAASANRKAPIAATGDRLIPQPTIVCFDNAEPKSVNLFRGKMGMHQNLHSGVMPTAVSAARGLLLCLNYSIAKPKSPSFGGAF